VVRDPRRHPALLALVGGSLGARRINDAALELFDRWRDREDVAIRHVAGVRDLERCEDRLGELRRPSDAMTYSLRGYEEDMVDLYGTSTVVVARAGAVTCAELAVTGTPSILVPLPHAPADHQTRNAEALERAGAAIVVTDADLGCDRLAAELEALLATAGRLDAMGRAATTLAEPRAAAAVADLVLEAAGVA
jgi:UDP-N-acetylglucosamine--N-acetylmuramyl-(pentapeptide) pyrophosphoryl-undecaprenol N-acetylglucosamine transferase